MFIGFCKGRGIDLKKKRNGCDPPSIFVIIVRNTISINNYYKINNDNNNNAVHDESTIEYLAIRMNFLFSFRVFAKNKSRLVIEREE